MSKIGRKPILFNNVKVEIKDGTVSINGSNANFIHKLPSCIKATLKDKVLILSVDNTTRKNKMLWGLHRALLANKIKGAEQDFEQKINIVGLGYKAQISGSKIVFSLGYSHKIKYEVPKGAQVSLLDKKGQLLIVKSASKNLLGDVCDTIKSFRLPEPYKGTGIIKEGEYIIRKAGKSKASA